ncbi:MAG: phospholipid/cholesterol/gamma-HCH transport system substrate-binding protein [Bryobacterales bacterium]|jgi:phospholipid/cholesterol/gamma-HCH transport system substrate-binding protein|nr:phospholipid/cholesterol/gamma-HCH transport system substrate-binding protein [Bryobacterales bacterium]
MKNKNVIVGLFVVGGLALFTAGMFVIGDRRQAFSRHVEYYAEFVNLAGLTNGAKVRVAGMDAGQVLAIRVPDSPLSRFRVTLKVDEKLRGLVRTDSVATIGTEGVVGDTFLSVRAGSRYAPAAAPLGTLRSKEPMELSDLLDQGTGLLSDVDGTIKQLGGKIDGALTGVTATVSNVNDVVVGLKDGRGTAGMLLRDQALAGQIRQAMSNVNDVTVGLKDGRGAAGMLLRDEALARQIRQAVTHAETATSDLGHAAGQADKLISDLQKRQVPKKLDETIDKVKGAASNIEEGTRQLKQIIAEVAMPDGQGMSAGANIRESLANANVATANIAEDTEALKHNFLFRGFFRRRGYFNITRMSPEKYRRDRVFSSPRNYRAWLAGSELFQKAENGQEELSQQGKGMLNAALTQYGDTAVESPVVIEGYWGGDNPADQLAFSRNRAILVREYLQSHFQLEPGNLGIVSMRNLPPAELGHSKWDGICIVIPKLAL